MEVNRISDLSQSLSAESLVKNYFENPESTYSSPSLEFLKDSANLFNCEEKTENGLLKTLNKRIALGVPYTSIGQNLIAVNCDFPGNWYFNNDVKSNNLKSKPHPYSISLNAYNKLKETQENQVISMLGVCGSGKTFNAIHVMDHLIKISTEDYIEQSEELCLDLFENMHRSIQLLHIMGSVCKKRNLESSSCVLDISIQFDKNFRCTGGKVQASLIDVSLPTPKKGRTYQILHSIMHCDPNTLKILGLSPNLPHKIFGNMESNIDFDIFDTEVNQRFFECLGFLDITLSEKKSFLELLTCVINLYEIDFVRKGQSLEPKNRWVLRKICKSLNIPESTFTNQFSQFASSEDCELHCKDLARFIYNKSFDWLANKVSHRLNYISSHLLSQRKLYSSSSSQNDSTYSPMYSISILDFPGFNKEKSLGGLIKNLAFESLNYFCSSNYLKLVDHLSKQKVSISGIKDSKAKQVVEFFLKSNSVLFSLFSNDKDFTSSWKPLKSDPIPEIFSFISSEDFKIFYTNGSVTYNLPSLRSQAKQHFFTDFNSNFLKACSNEILGKRQAKSILRIDEIFTGSLRKILLPYLNLSPWVIFCLKSEIKAVDKKSLEFLRNSTVFPSLIWNWYGFPHWVRVSDMAQELGLGSGAGLLQVKNELLKRFKWKDIQFSEDFVMLRKNQMKELKKIIKNGGGGDGSNLTDLSMSLSLFSLSADEDFVFTVHEDSTHCMKVASRPTVINTPFTFVDIEKVFEDSEAMTQSTTKDKYSLNASFNDSVIIVKPGNTSKPQVYRTVNYSKIDYSGCIGDIVYIQKLWRGYQSRKYIKALKVLSTKATKIQSLWKGYLVRKTFKPVLVYQKSAFIIQKYWKLYCIRKKIATRMIQRWYRKIKGFKFSIEKLYPDSKTMLENNLKKHAQKLKKNIDKKIGDPKNAKILDDTKNALEKFRSKNLETKKKSKINERERIETPQGKKKQMVHSSESKDFLSLNSNQSFSSQKSSKSNQVLKKKPEFTPNLSKASQKLANKKLSQFSDLSITDRFKILEANRIEKIHKKRQEKLESETYSYIPSVHKNSNIKNSFEQRQENYLKNAKLKLEQINKFLTKDEKFSFSPTIAKTSRSRSPDQTVEDLYKWAKMKEKKLGQARDKKLTEENEKLGDYKVGENSLIYSNRKKSKLTENRIENDRAKRNNSPYWPSTDR